MLALFVFKREIKQVLILGRLVGSFFVFNLLVLKHFKIYFNWYFVLSSSSVPAYFNSLKLKFMFLSRGLFVYLLSFSSLVIVVEL